MNKKYRKIVIAGIVLLTLIVGFTNIKISGPKSASNEVAENENSGPIILDDEFDENQQDEEIVSEEKTVHEKDNVSDSLAEKESGPQSLSKDDDKGEKTSSDDKKDKNKDKSKKEKTNDDKEEKYVSCFISIDCNLLVDGIALKENGNENKQEFVPEDGKIAKNVQVKVKEGSSVYDVLRSFCKKKSIQLEASYTAGFGGYYVEGINHLYEFDGGTGSGWVYFVNGQMPNYAASEMTVSEGDTIQWMYTLDYGYDVEP